VKYCVEIFLDKTKLASLTQNTAIFAETNSKDIGSEEIRHVFAENCQKQLKMANLVANYSIGPTWPRDRRRVVLSDAQDRVQVDHLLRDGERVLVVEVPEAAVGENAPGPGLPDFTR
jgi:hypothetical protein